MAAHISGSTIRHSTSTPIYRRRWYYRASVSDSQAPNHLGLSGEFYTIWESLTFQFVMVPVLRAAYNAPTRQVIIIGDDHSRGHVVMKEISKTWTRRKIEHVFPYFATEARNICGGARWHFPFLKSTMAK